MALLSFLFSMALPFVVRATSPTPGYPSHWWTPVPRSSAPAWEILPQDAGPGEVILSKRNELGILSNFAETPFIFEGVRYASVEGFWQALKYPEDPSDPRWKWAPQWPYTRGQVAALSGFEAKRAGEFANHLMKKNKAMWVSYRGRALSIWTTDQNAFEQLIRATVVEKMRQNPTVREILLRTGTLKLRPDHEVEWYSPKAWKYHLLWMEIREGLQRGWR